MPRRSKPRQQQQHIPTPLIQASDYESDIHHYDDTQILPTTRSNTELNLSVLRRYNPSIRSILSIAANAVVYLFTPESQQWEKSGVEGTLFVCDQEHDATTGNESFCVVVLNRRGLDNIILDLGQTQDVEVASDLVIMQLQNLDGADESQKVVGLWIHEDKGNTRELNAGLIQQCWEKARLSRIRAIEQSDSFGTGLSVPEPVGVGRRISLTDLFRQQSSQY